MAGFAEAVGRLLTYVPVQIPVFFWCFVFLYISLFSLFFLPFPSSSCFFLFFFVSPVIFYPFPMFPPVPYFSRTFLCFLLFSLFSFIFPVFLYVSLFFSLPWFLLPDFFCSLLFLPIITCFPLFSRFFCFSAYKVLFLSFFIPLHSKAGVRPVSRFFHKLTNACVHQTKSACLVVTFTSTCTLFIHPRGRLAIHPAGRGKQLTPYFSRVQ